MKAGRLLLLNSNLCTYPYPVYPLGLAHVASFMADNGYDVRLFDCALGVVSDLAMAVREFQPDFVGISLRNVDCDTFCQKDEPQYPSDKAAGSFRRTITLITDAIRCIRSLSVAPIILGGSGFSLFPRHILSLCQADFGVWGEGERPLLQLCECIKAGADPRHIEAVVCGGSDAENEATRINNSFIDPSAINAALRPSDLCDYYCRVSSMGNVQTQRGCPFSCCYCSYPFLEGGTVRYRCLEAVIGELELLCSRKVGYVAVVDSLFNTSEEHVAAFCEAMIRAHVPLQWCCFLRPSIRNPMLFSLMKRAGCSHVEFGTDALCDETLEGYGKNFTVAEVVHASKRCADNQIHQAHFLIFGGLSETERSVKKTLHAIQFLEKATFFATIGMSVYPHTPLWTHLRKTEGVTGEAPLPPRLFISPHLSRKRILNLIQTGASDRRSIIIGKVSPELYAVSQKLRSRGIRGPLWEFLSR
ncbi:MAG: cobalamin-dependent protein [Chitinivibrionales bacterium]|nr:cobalamin-dependent protein [Chitinivibrionales bacterium]